MSHPVAVVVGAVAAVGVLAAAVIDYNYPPPTDFVGIGLLITAVGGVITVVGTQIVSLVKQRQTHDLVNSLSNETKRDAAEAAEKALIIAKEKAFAEGKLAGALEEAAARGKLLQAAQMPQVPVPKG